jgi:hypothetical protein
MIAFFGTFGSACAGSGVSDFNGTKQRSQSRLD